MLHRGRTHRVVEVERAEDLAEMLVEHTWTLCTGFRHGGLLWLNDSTGPDGAQEFAVVRDRRQIESITFSWCSQPEALALIQRMVAGELGLDCGPVQGRLDPSPHHHCPHCA